MRDTGENKKRYIALSKDIATRTLDDEAVIMSPRDSSLFTLNEPASVVWNAADGVTPLDQIVEQRVCAEFEVELEQALRDAEELVNELAQHGILVVSDSPISEAA